jgi:hypothetical protein
MARRRGVGSGHHSDLLGGDDRTVNPPEVLCPKCGDQLDRDGMCFGENPDAPHAALHVGDTWQGDPSGRPDVSRITLTGDMITKPWRYK